MDRGNAEQTAIDKQCIFIEASAKHNTNVKEIFEQLLLTFHGMESMNETENTDRYMSKSLAKKKNATCAIL